jgi:hypothetical protein
MTSMALAIGTRGPRRARSLRIGAVVGIAAGLAVILLVALLSSRSPSGGAAEERAAQQLAVDDWENAVHPLVLSSGEVVARGPRTGVADLAGRKVGDARMRTLASGWVRQLSELRTQLAAVATPVALRPAHDLLDTAMAGYVTASQDLLDAASATGARRAGLLTAAAAAGKAADRQYDQAAAAIAHLRAALNLPTDWSGS